MIVSLNDDDILEIFDSILLKLKYHKYSGLIFIKI